MEEVVSHAVQAVKGLSFSADGKTVTLETYLSFADKKEYKLTYDKKDFNFTASVGAVASVVIKTDKVVFGTETAVKYVLYDANGIDITSVVDASRVTVDFETTNGYATDDGKITLFNKGDVATVKVTYHTYTYENGEEVTVSAKGSIVAVDASELTFGNYEKYTIAKTEPTNWNNVTTSNTRIAIGDTGYEIYLRVKDSSDKYIAQSEIKYTSSNKDVLIADENGTLYPIKEGSVYVIATTGKTSWTLPVNVVAERKVASIAVNKSAVTVSNTVNIPGGDVAKIDVTVKDQYGDKVPGAIVTVNEVNSRTGYNAPVATPNGTTIEFNGLNATKGSYTFVIESNQKKISVNVTVLKPEGSAVTDKLLLSTNYVDTVIEADTVLADKDIVISVGKYTGGVLDGYTTMTNVTVYKPNGAELVSGAAINTLTVQTTPVATGVSGSAIQKLATGTYKVVAKIAGQSDKISYFTIKDTQVLPSIRVDKLTVDSITNELNAAIEALTVKDNDGRELEIKAATGKVFSNQVYVDKITVIHEVGAHDIETTLNVNRTFILK
jgi:hypothetical protein